MSLDKSAREVLKQHVDAIETLEAEKKEISETISERWKWVAEGGFDKKALKEVLKRRKMSRVDRETQEQLVDLYMHALGMTPLEELIEAADRGEVSVTTVGDDGKETTVLGKKAPREKRGEPVH